MTKFISIFISIIMFLFPMLNIPHAEVNRDNFNTEYTNVFVHGFSGWGEYDDVYKLFPYWGVRNGDLMKYLNARGFDCHAATVAPAGSAWDRACELYAQLMGTVTDYGEAHSKRCRHDRFGKDYSECRLIDDWSASASGILKIDEQYRAVLTALEYAADYLRSVGKLVGDGDARLRVGNEAFDLDALAGCEIVALPEHPAGGVDLHVVNRLLGREHNALPILVNSDRAEDIQAAAVELVAVVGKQHAVFALVFNGHEALVDELFERRIRYLKQQHAAAVGRDVIGICVEHKAAVAEIPVCAGIDEVVYRALKIVKQYADAALFIIVPSSKADDVVFNKCLELLLVFGNVRKGQKRAVIGIVAAAG